MRSCRIASNFLARQTLATVAPAGWSCRRFTATEGQEAEANAAKSPKEIELEGKVEKLTADLTEKTNEVLEMKKQAQYALAEAENARRIAKIDVDKAKDYSVTAIAKDMLEVADTLARAVEAFHKLDKEAEQKAGHVLTGVKMSLNVLTHNLNRHGIEKIAAAKGQKFDPAVHEAIVNAPSTAEIPAEHIAFVIKEGYMIKDRVLRPAQVGVAKPPE